MMRSVLVLGGTGFVGRALCEQLARRHPGCAVTVPTRRPGHGRPVQCLPAVKLIESDLHDDRSLHDLVRRHDAVVNLVAILHGSAAQFEQVHVQLPRRVAAACQTAGVRRLVHVSALGVGADPDAAPSRYLRSKSAGEMLLRQAGLDLTVLRPSVIFGAQDRFLNLFAAMQAVLPVIPLACAQARFQPVWVEDVAHAIVQALNRPDSAHQTFECVGPDVHALADLVRLAGRWAGHERPVWPLPAIAGRVQAALMSLLPGEPLMSADNLDSMRLPNVASGLLPGLEALGIRAAALEAIGPTYLGRRHQRAVHRDHWRSLARR